jgi:hypothetical protein
MLTFSALKSSFAVIVVKLDAGDVLFSVKTVRDIAFLTRMGRSRVRGAGRADRGRYGWYVDYGPNLHPANNAGLPT